MPIHIARQTLAGVPVLLARPTPAAAPPPIVLWFHGFRADAAANEAELAQLADVGFLAVGVDAVGHGVRRAGDIDARIAGAPGGARSVMLEMAAATVAELPALLAALADGGLGDPARVAVVGVSMGGYLAYRAALAVPGVRVAVAVLGSPEWPDDASPHRHPAAFQNLALLSITAERDVNVPPGPARQLHAALATGHPAPERARYLELPGAEHLMTAAQWAAAMDETRRWLSAHL